MCLRTWAVCDHIGCAARTGLYKLKTCPHFDERTHLCSGEGTESTKLIKGDIPCLDCAKKDAAAKTKAGEGNKSTTNATKKVKWGAMLKK
jgi:hypothetical protein